MNSLASIHNHREVRGFRRETGENFSEERRLVEEKVKEKREKIKKEKLIEPEIKYFSIMLITFVSFMYI